MKTAEEVAARAVDEMQIQYDDNDLRQRDILYLAQALTAFAEKRVKETIKAAKFWSDIDVNGKAFDIEQAKLELIDYHFLLEQIPTVYDNVTGGLLSKPLYSAETVVDAFQDFLSRECDEAAKEARAETLEEAAEIADKWGYEALAKAIRALKDKP
jgi:hypothetical protein